MTNKLVGSNLARTMLNRGDQHVWCAVSNKSDEQAVAAINDSDYTCIYRIVTFKDGCFFCNKGNSWTYAVPVKRNEMSQDEVEW